MQNKDNRITVAGDNNIIIQDAEHGQRSVPKYLTMPPAEPPTTFVGREEALEQLHQSLQSQQRLLLASGIRGIGKTTLAQAYFHKHQSDYQCMAWVNCPSGILQGLLECTIDDSLGFKAQRDNWERHYQLVWKKLANLQGKHLLILDNANDGNEVLRYLKAIPNWTILVTTTAAVSEVPTLRVEKLLDDAAITLFYTYCPTAVGQNELLLSLFQAIEYHTLTIEILAKNLTKLYNYDLQQLCKDLEERGVLYLPKSREVYTSYRPGKKLEIQDIIREIFDITELQDYHQNILLKFSLLPRQPISYNHLFEKLAIQEKDEKVFSKTLDELEENGWIEFDQSSRKYRIHSLIAEVIVDKAISNNKKDIGKLEELLSINPKSESLMNSLAFSYGNQGALYQAKNSIEFALQFFEKENNYLKILYKNTPSSEISKNNLAISFSKLGTICQWTGQFNRALELFDKANNIYEELYRNNPHNENLRNGLAISYERLGDLWKNKGDFNRALDFFEKDAKLTEELYRDNPQNENLKNGLAISYSKLGDLWQNKGDFNRALDFFEKYNQLCEELYQANPHNENLKFQLSVSCERLGVLWQNKGDFNRALEFFEKDAKLTEELYRDNPHSEQLKNGLAISYNKLGLLWLAQNDLEKALPYMQEALQLMEAMVAENPHSFTLQNNRCFFWRDMGEVLEALDRKEEALALYEQAAAGWQALWEQTELPEIKKSLDWVRARIAELSTGES